MNHPIAATLLAGLVVLALPGCNETKKSTAKQETTITTPVGKTTITTEREVKQTGETPPKTMP